MGVNAPFYPTWPKLASRLSHDPAIERRVEEILRQMSLPEKIAQMIQPELYELTPEEAGKHKFGSALNGAGIAPNGNRYASQAEWVQMVDSYWVAVEQAFAERPFRIPFMWATDAVHGHNNVFGATIFPHNVGLGCADDADLVRRIGAATAREIAATGMDWTFAPTVTTPRDYRWGRHFEGYSEEPGIVYEYSAAMVEGLQGFPETYGLRSPDRVIACVKHWLADGGTFEGVDRGDCFSDEEVLRNVHAMGYFSGLEAGAQSVMISFSGWRDPLNYDHSPDLPGSYNFKLCGSRYLITDVLKGAMGFDGIVISDWEAHTEVSRCTLGDAGYAINAGVDVLMISSRRGWSALLQTTERQVLGGEISLSRVDDAVRRILRVKMRAGLWEKPRPSERILSVDRDILGCAEHKALARESVRKSLVLLKNNRHALPIQEGARILIVGTAANDIQKQTGGWTLSWQGNDVGPCDFPQGQTLAQSVAAAVGEENCCVDPSLNFADPADFDVIIVGIGEDAYAEMRGTIRPWRSLEYSKLKQSYGVDLRILQQLSSLRASGASTPTIVTVFFTGRPLYVSEEINHSDAFVVAWLPGPSCEGVCDILFAGADGHPRHDFTGRLRFSWPGSKTSFAINTPPSNFPELPLPPGEQHPSGKHAPLFPFGYGLTYRDVSPDIAPVPLDSDIDETPLPPLAPGFEILSQRARDTFSWTIKGHNTWSGEPVSLESGARLLVMDTQPIQWQSGTVGLRLTFKGFPAFLYAQFPDNRLEDFRAYVQADAYLDMQIQIFAPPSGPLMLACHDDFPAQPGLDLRPQIERLGPGWHSMAIPLRDLAGAGVEFRHVNTPFMIYSEHEADIAIGEIRLIVPGMASA